jgi:shikimate dehydrogenase
LAIELAWRDPGSTISHFWNVEEIIMVQKSYPVLCGSIAGRPSQVGAQIHRAGYQYLDLDYTYVAFGVDDAEPALLAMRTLGIRGLGVTMPFKEKVLPYLDEIDPMAGEIGAVNTIVNDNGKLIGHNVDWLGAVRAIEEQTTIAGKRVIVVGAGGAARAIACGMKHEGASEVEIFNRTPEKAQRLAMELDCQFGGGLDALQGTADYDILIQATSVGYHNVPPTDCIVPRNMLKPGKVVLDIVAEPTETLLIKWASEAGCSPIPGWRMRLYQAHLQFQLYTERELPLDVLEKALLKAMGS